MLTVVFFFAAVALTGLSAGLWAGFVAAGLGEFLLDLAGDVSAAMGRDIRVIATVIKIALIALDPVRTGDLVNDVSRTARKAPT